MLTSNSLITFKLVANKTQSTVIQVTLQSGSQARNYAVAFVVVDPISLTTSPFTDILTLWNSGTTYTYVAFATGDPQVTTNGRVNYAWIFKVLHSKLLSQLFLNPSELPFTSTIRKECTIQYTVLHEHVNSTRRKWL